MLQKVKEINILTFVMKKYTINLINKTKKEAKTSINITRHFPHNSLQLNKRVCQMDFKH